MQHEKEPCPLCLAAPADWCEDPHEKGWKPWRTMETAPRDCVVWLLCSDGKEREAYHDRGARWRVNGENGCVIDVNQVPDTVAMAAIRWREA